jgi:hypothetical protein
MRRKNGMNRLKFDKLENNRHNDIKKTCHKDPPRKLVAGFRLLRLTRRYSLE